MAALQLLKTVVTVGAGTKTYYFKGSITKYASADIQTGTGILPATDDERDEIPHRVGDLLLGGVLIRLGVTTGTSALNRKNTDLLCQFSKVNTVRNAITAATDKGILGATLGGQPVSSVRVKRDMVNVG